MGKDVFHDPLSLVDVGEFAAAKHHRHDHLVFVLKEPLGLVHLELDVVISRLGAESNLLDLRLMDVGFVLFLLLLVFELAEVHDPADGRLLVGRHLDQIETRLAGDGECFLRGDDAKLATVGADDPDRSDPNLLIDAMLLLDGSRLRPRIG